MFIFPLSPYAPLFSIIGLSLNYLLDKYILIRRCKRPCYLSGEYAIAIVYVIGYGWFHYVIGNLLFSFDFKLEYNV